MRSDRPANKWSAFAAIGLSMMTIVLASTMVFVLLDAIASDFGVTLRAVGWVVIVDSLIVSALLLPMGGVADRIGRRRVYIAGLVLFGVGSVLTGLAATFEALIAARVVSSLGNALVQSVMTAMVVAVFPPEERGRAIGGQTTAVSVGAACGPLVAGFALQVTSWELLFILLAVPSAASIVAGLMVLPPDGGLDEDDEVGDLADIADLGAEGDASSGRSFDPVGGLLAAVVVVALIVTIGNPLALSWLSAPILGGLVAVAAAMAAFIRWELRHPAPLLDLRLFASPLLQRSVSIRFLGFIGYAATSLLLPVYLISLRGVADGLAGTIVFVVAVGMGISAQISGVLSDRVGPRPPSLAGLSLQIGVAVALIVWAETVPMGVLAVVVFAAGFASGLWNVPNNSTMMGVAPPEGLAVVGALSNVTRTLGTVVGQAVATALVVGVMAAEGFDIPLNEIADAPGADRAFIAGWRAAFGATIVTSVVALVVALGYSARDALPPPATVDIERPAIGRKEANR